MTLGCFESAAVDENRVLIGGIQIHIDLCFHLILPVQRQTSSVNTCSASEA